MTSTIETKPRKTLTIKKRSDQIVKADVTQPTPPPVEQRQPPRKIINNEAAKQRYDTKKQQCNPEPVVDEITYKRPTKEFIPGKRGDPDFVGYILSKAQRAAMRREITEARKAAHARYMKESSSDAHKHRKLINATLRQLYPVVWKECLPLAKNAQKAIMDAIKEALPDIPTRAARDAIGWHTRSRRYLENVAKGGARFDLEGIECGTITQGEMEYSIAMLEKYKKRSETMRSGS